MSKLLPIGTRVLAEIDHDEQFGATRWVVATIVGHTTGAALAREAGMEPLPGSARMKFVKVLEDRTPPSGWRIAVQVRPLAPKKARAR